MEASSLTSMLAAGDVDAMRHMLRAQAGPKAPASPTAPSMDPLTQRANSIADDILQRGLVHLEAEAAATAKQEAADAAARLSEQHISLPDLGLILLSQPVMGQPVWPAALALSRWLLDRVDVCRGAHVLELGAGCAAPSLVAHRAGAASVAMTDADEGLLRLMRTNATLNGCDCAEPTPASGGSEAGVGGGGEGGAASSSSAALPSPHSVGLLDWRVCGDVSRWVNRSARGDGFELLLAADILFGVGDIEPVARAAARLLRAAPHSRFLLARSPWFEELQPTLVAGLENVGLALLSTAAAADATVLEFGRA